MSNLIKWGDKAQITTNIESRKLRIERCGKKTNLIQEYVSYLSRATTYFIDTWMELGF